MRAYIYRAFCLIFPIQKGANFDIFFPRTKHKRRDLFSRAFSGRAEGRQRQREREDRERERESAFVVVSFSFEGSSFLSDSLLLLFSLLLFETRQTTNEKSLFLSRFSVRVRRDDRDAPEIYRRGDVFIVPGVHRGGVFGDWDTRQHGRFVFSFVSSLSSFFFAIERKTLY